MKVGACFVCLMLLLFWPQKPVSQALRQSTEELQQETRSYRSMLETGKYPAHLVRYNLALSLIAQDSLNEAVGMLLTALPYLESPYKAEAFNLLGVVDAKARNYSAALEYFRQAIKANQTNEVYKRNYELAAKLLAQSPPPATPPQSIKTNQPNKPQFSSSKPTEHLGKQWTYQPIDADQAEALMQMLQQREEQYIQQLRKTVRKQRQFSSRPQW